jgi:catechol 2,3-dioxygenase-like lactoylglutathione lyase family enzyme
VITALDHFVLISPDIETAVTAYQLLLGQRPAWRAEADGIATAVFETGNTALEIMAPVGDSPGADRLREISAEGAKLTSLVYRSDDIAADHHLMTRRGLGPSDITGGSSTHAETGVQRTWQRFRIPDQRMAGLKTFILQPHPRDPSPPPPQGSVTALDHLVINTPNPERAVANYGARLGLRLALDRTAEEWKTRFLFFRTGGLTLEVIHRLGQAHDPADPDSIWGLTWETDDLTAAHQRLSDAGLDLSEIRTGRKPGSEVFTVRNGTQNVPTLFIAHSTR